MTHQPLPAFTAVSGSRQPRIVFVGEAWGRDEDALRKPFVGESGKELFRMLGEAMPDIAPELHAKICDKHKYGLAWVADREQWFEEAQVAFTNVLAFNPPDNKIEALCGTKKEVGGDDYHFPPITKGKYLQPQYLPELDRLREEILSLAPNLLVALGNTASWALLYSTNISQIRGSIARTAEISPGAGAKCLPTYHPAGVLRSWAWRPIVVADLMKANREAAFPEVRRPERRILVNPTLQEVREFIANCRMAAAAGKCNPIGADTETEGGQITCISFAPQTHTAMTIPFWDKTKPGWSYWASAVEEAEVWDLIESLMTDPAVELLWQNGLYDFQYCLPMKLPVDRSREDTMLLHHSIYPEMQKGLGFLGSIYTNEASWKLMRRWKTDSEKRDE